MHHTLSATAMMTHSGLPCISAADSEDSTVSIQIKLENEGSDEELETDMLYSPQLALKMALSEWLNDFGVPHQYNSKSPRPSQSQP